MYRRASWWGILLLLCNGFAGRVFVSSLCDCMSGGNGTSCAIFSVLHGRYEIVPAVQYFPYCVAGTKWYLLCIFYRFLPIFPYCTAGTWVFASRGVPLKTRSPKGPQNTTPVSFFGALFGPFSTKMYLLCNVVGQAFFCNLPGTPAVQQ